MKAAELIDFISRLHPCAHTLDNKLACAWEELKVLKQKNKAM